MGWRETLTFQKTGSSLELELSGKEIRVIVGGQVELS